MCSSTINISHSKVSRMKAACFETSIRKPKIYILCLTAPYSNEVWTLHSILVFHSPSSAWCILYSASKDGIIKCSFIIMNTSKSIVIIPTAKQTHSSSQAHHHHVNIALSREYCLTHHKTSLRYESLFRFLYIFIVLVPVWQRQAKTAVNYDSAECKYLSSS